MFSTRMQRYYWYCLIGLWLVAFQVSAQNQTIPFTTVNLQSLADFKPTGSNWKLVGDVFYDPNKAGAGSTKPGTGILVNDLSGKSKDQLFTIIEHGDIDLELDFMMEKGTNSGLYLQGRYEVQLYDSWGVKDPKYLDCGAIYERWDESRPEGRKGYEPHPPVQNAGRAPGLWQHMKISFQAPRFNEKGEKIANARFIKVILNGVTVQENIEVTGPTRSAAFTDEKPTGSLMIQGDHGPVAFRNIQYKAYGTESVALSKLKLSAYEGKFKSVDEFSTLTPKQEMPITILAHQAPGSRDNFGGKITGNIHIPHSGQYVLNLDLSWIPAETDPNRPNGAGELLIDSKKALSISGKNGGTASATINLVAGDYPVVLAYYKNFGLWYARSNDIFLTVEGPGVQYTLLNPIIRTGNPPGQIALRATTEPVIQRGFINHHGIKHTHTIAVGEQDLTNYSFDLRSGELLQIWHGDFLETTPMWYGRGETQLALPLGSVIELSAKPSLAFLADQTTAWPDSIPTHNNLGYDIDKAGRPVFKYTIGGAMVKESFASVDEGRKLSHSFTITSGSPAQAVWCRVAEGSDITLLPNGLYAVNDKQYFIELTGADKPIIRDTAQKTKEMLLPIKATNNVGALTYSIVW